ncbi:MAG: glutamate racemase [Heliobacteriaceae bacterium]|nr:glutamate racemase [Heliobacteriaceae bacterium]
MTGPIGVFDSGIGGFTVVREIFHQLPDEEIIYFGDTAHVPYGPRPAEELIRFATEITQFLVSQKAKMIVVACNTSSSLALDRLRAKFRLPIVGVVNPGADEAVRVTCNGRVGVLATEATIRKGMHRQRINEKSSQIKVFGQACPSYVPFVEAGKCRGPEVEQATREYLQPLLAADVDTIILGCTHYPFLQPVIRAVVGDEVLLIDPACHTVLQVKELIQRGVVSARDPLTGPPVHRFFVSGDQAAFVRVGGPLLGKPIAENVRQVCLDSSPEAGQAAG